MTALVDTNVVLDVMLSREPHLADFATVLHEAALQAGADCIVTRNINDFTRATIPVFLPTQFLKMLE